MNSEYVALMFKLGQARVNAQRVMKNSFENNDTPEIKKLNTRLFNRNGLSQYNLIYSGKLKVSNTMQ
jgi:hypothetical protein